MVGLGSPVPDWVVAPRRTNDVMLSAIADSTIGLPDLVRGDTGAKFCLISFSAFVALVTSALIFEAFVASALADSSPGVSTMEAVERGCLLMLRAFVREQVSLAREQFAGNVSLFLTGGDALLVRDIDKDFRLVPDLVLHGLALACPLGDK